MESFREILEQIHDEADHILGTEAEKPLEVALTDAKSIRSLARKGLALLREVNVHKAIPCHG